MNENFLLSPGPLAIVLIAVTVVNVLFFIGLFASKFFRIKEENRLFVSLEGFKAGMEKTYAFWSLFWGGAVLLAILYFVTEHGFSPWVFAAGFAVLFVVPAVLRFFLRTAAGEPAGDWRIILAQIVGFFAVFLGIMMLFAQFTAG
ncbi:hypothetical protein FGB90_10150 [Alteribacter natronophilus]|nr:hypothetical protein FGB90_10150 [Alteribacter natronophilus]